MQIIDNASLGLSSSCSVRPSLLQSPSSSFRRSVRGRAHCVNLCVLRSAHLSFSHFFFSVQCLVVRHAVCVILLGGETTRSGMVCWMLRRGVRTHALRYLLPAYAPLERIPSGPCPNEGVHPLRRFHAPIFLSILHCRDPEQALHSTAPPPRVDKQGELPPPAWTNRVRAL